MLQNGLSSGQNTFNSCISGIQVQSGDEVLGEGLGLTRAFISGNIMTAMQQGVDFIGNINTGTVRTSNITVDQAFTNDFRHAINIVDRFVPQSGFILNNNEITINIANGNGITANVPNPAPTTTFVNVRDNDHITIEKGGEAVRARNVGTVNVTENDIFIKDDTPDFLPAVRISGGDGHEVLCNNTFNNRLDNLRIGFLFEAPENSTYFGNDMTDFHDGMQFDEDCGDFNDIAHNNFLGEMNIGLFYSGSDPITGPQTNKGNNWANGNFTTAAFHNNPGIAVQSEYTVHPTQLPPSVNPTSGWFDDDGQIVASETCDPPGPPFTPAPVPLPLMGGLNGSILAGEETALSEGNLFERKRRLFEAIKANPELMNGNSAVENFYLLHENGAIGKLVQVKESIQNAYSVDEVTRQQIEALESNIDGSFSALEQTLTLLGQNSYDSSLLDQLANQETSLATESDNLSIILKNAIVGEQAFDAIATLNNSFVAETTPEYNEQALNNIYLDVILRRTREINENDKAIIANIANQCYALSGSAVFWARGWHRQLSGQFINTVDCSLEQANRLSHTDKPTIGQSGLVVEPNPNDGKMNIRLGRTVENGHVLIVSDLTGRKLKEVHINEDQILVPLNIQDFASGMYLLSLLNGDKVITTEKFIIE